MHANTSSLIHTWTFNFLSLFLSLAFRVLYLPYVLSLYPFPLFTLLTSTMAFLSSKSPKSFTRLKLVREVTVSRRLIAGIGGTARKTERTRVFDDDKTRKTQTNDKRFKNRKCKRKRKNWHTFLLSYERQFRRMNYTPTESKANWQPRSSEQVRPNFPHPYPPSSDIYFRSISFLPINCLVLSFIFGWSLSFFS